MTTTMPLLFEVGLHTYQPGGDDGYGNPTTSYDPPKTDPGTPYKVAGWAVVRSAETTGNQDRVQVNLQLFTDTTFPATQYALVDIDGRQYEVTGLAEDYNHGPWWVSDMVVWNLTWIQG